MRVLSVVFVMVALIIPTILLAQPQSSDEISAAQLAQMSGHDVLILGEIHDNPHHHAGQAEIIRHAQPKAVVFEMLTAAQAKQVNAMPLGDRDALGARIGWEAAGWPDFTIYAPVFEAIGNTPVVGAAAPNAIIRLAFEEGAASAFGQGAARYGLNQPVPDAELDRRKALQFAAHCDAMPMQMMGDMVEAQRLRDALFSAAVLTALDIYGSPVVALVGNGHARKDWGMPAMITQAKPEADVLSIGFVEVPSLENDPRFDVTLPTPRVPRSDPCKAFRTD